MNKLTDEERKARKRIKDKKYRESGRATEVQRKYRATERYKEVERRYRQSEKYKIKQERCKRTRKLTGQISLMLLDGKTNAEIMKELNISYDMLMSVKEDMQ